MLNSRGIHKSHSCKGEKPVSWNGEKPSIKASLRET
jgi:hypothetical protein